MRFALILSIFTVQSSFAESKSYLNCRIDYSVAYKLEGKTKIEKRKGARLVVDFDGPKNGAGRVMGTIDDPFVENELEGVNHSSELATISMLTGDRAEVSLDVHLRNGGSRYFPTFEMRGSIRRDGSLQTKVYLSQVARDGKLIQTKDGGTIRSATSECRITSTAEELPFEEEESYTE